MDKWGVFVIYVSRWQEIKANNLTVKVKNNHSLK